MMDACRPSSRPQLPAKASLISSSLKLDAWSDLLAHHPDRAFTAYILDEICQGFRIGFEYSHHICYPAKKNMQSAADVPQMVSRYQDMECRLGSVVILDDKSAQSVQTSPFGLIPKWEKPDDWCLILDLSSPLGHSVNDGINPTRCLLKYASNDQAVCICRSLGEALLSKLDIKSAYCMVPVHPNDCHLLGMRWRGAIYIDTALPFRLHSTPKVFFAVTDALIWAMHQNRVMHGLYYLHVDNFLFTNQAGTAHDNSQLRIATHLPAVRGTSRSGQNP